MRSFRGASIACVFCVSVMRPVSASAMEIQQFDKMTGPDQNEFVAELIIGAQNVLTAAGHPEQAAQVRKLFTEIEPGDQISDGMAEFEIVLAKVRLADAQRMEKDPSAHRLEVEDAMAITLKRNGAVVPDAFFTVASGFRPKHPPRN
jgi:hypothetical protein